MAKNRYNKMQGGMQGNAQYNRPSGGYQKNLYKQQMNTAGIKQPKGLDQKTFRNIAIAVGVVWVIASVLLIMKMKWWGLLISMLIGLAVVAGGYFFIQYKEKEIIKYYKQIGMSEEMYIKERDVYQGTQKEKRRQEADRPGKKDLEKGKRGACRWRSKHRRIKEQQEKMILNNG